MLHSRGMQDPRGQCDRGLTSQMTPINMSGWPGWSITRTFWVLVGWFQDLTGITRIIISGKLKEDECAQACRETQLCSNYNFLNLEDPLRWDFNFPNYFSELFFKLLYWWLWIRRLIKSINCKDFMPPSHLLRQHLHRLLELPNRGSTL